MSLVNVRKRISRNRRRDHRRTWQKKKKVGRKEKEWKRKGKKGKEFTGEELHRGDTWRLLGEKEEKWTQFA